MALCFLWRSATFLWLCVVIPSFLPHQKTKVQSFFSSLKMNHNGLLRVGMTCCNIFLLQQNQYSYSKQCNLSLYYLSSSLPQLSRLLVWYKHDNISTPINISPHWNSGSWYTCKKNKKRTLIRIFRTSMLSTASVKLQSTQSRVLSCTFGPSRLFTWCVPIGSLLYSPLF